MQTLNSEQAAKFLGLSVQKTLELARQGEFPGVCWGNSWTFIQEELERWLLEKSRQEQEERLLQRMDNPNPTPTRGPTAKGKSKARNQLIEV